MANYRQLKVWELSHSLTLEVYKLTSNFPNEELYAMTSQMRRAAYSVPSNIIEGKIQRYSKGVQTISNNCEGVYR